jgi:transcriptional regulator with XRE-family HTH domain
MFSENLKTLRRQKGMSQEILAQRLNVVRQTVSKWEKGLSVPDAEMLAKLADLFEVSAGDLLGVEIKDENEINEIAAQLALLNEYLANRRIRQRKIWRGILIAVVAIVLLSLLSNILLTKI